MSEAGAPGGIVVDTSAMVAILTDEPGRAWLKQQLIDATSRLMAAPVALELGIVLEARTDAPSIGRRALSESGIDVVAFDEELAERALVGWRRFGKGRHPAGLNLADCFTYALADATGLPILCTGPDFSRTDLAVLSPPSR